MTETPSIAIIGAGPAGLTLAKLLLISPLFTTGDNAGIKISIYELDAGAKSRTHQGGTLDLHPKTGLLALKRMGLWETALPFLRYEGEELVIGDQNATEYVHIRQTPDIAGKVRTGNEEIYERPEIDREKLKEILLEAVGEEKVVWGRKVRRVLETERMVEFEDGGVEGPFDLIVGRDGAFSKVRNVLTDVRPRYSGVCAIEGQIKKPKESCPEVDAMVGRGSYFAFSDGRSLMGQRMGNDSLKLSCNMKKEQTWLEAVWKEKGDNVEAIREVLLDEFSEWVEEMKDWIRASEKFWPWFLYELPIGQTWDHKKGFTLLGDAAHLCTPFAGLGVNTAMNDALELSELVIQSVQGQRSLSLDEAVEQYEKSMFPRAKHVQAKTMKSKESMFSPDSPMSFLSTMVGVAAEETGWSLNKGVLRWIPVTRAVSSLFWVIGSFGACRRWYRETFGRAKAVR